MTFHQFDEGFCVLSKISRINFLYKKGCVVETAQPFAFGQFRADLCNAYSCSRDRLLVIKRSKSAPCKRPLDSKAKSVICLMIGFPVA